MSALRIRGFDSAYPGSMSEREDGGYVQRDDPRSLAGALLELVRSGDRAARNLLDDLDQAAAELAKANAQRDSLLIALIGCVEHMECSTPQGLKACDDAAALITAMGGDA